MIEFETHFLEVIPRTPSVKSFRLKPPAGGAAFKAGQYLSVAIKVSGGQIAKPFSFSDSPTEKQYLEFTKRITDSGYSKALDAVKAGDTARVRMPFGSFTFEGEYPKIAFLAGGIGITPVRSISRFVTDSKIPTDIVLLYGSSKEENIIFRDDFDRMQKANKNMRVVYTLTGLDVGGRWKGKRGCIDEKMIAEEIPDYKERVFYVCGPPAMVQSLIDILKNKLGISDAQVRLEKFAGY